MKRWILVISLIVTMGACAKADKTLSPQPPPKPALGEPLVNLTRDELRRFTAGKEVFERLFSAGTGLGPLFNAPSCAACHEAPVTGGEGEFEDEDIEVHATRLAQGRCDLLIADGGPVFRKHSTLTELRPPMPPANAQRGLRSTPPVFGFGLIDALPESAVTLERRRDVVEAPALQPVGRPHVLPGGVVGRFGRKANVATLDEFTVGAFLIEQGVEVPQELSRAEARLAADFMRFLAPPAINQPQTAAEQRRFDRGARVFQKIGCAACHTPVLKTGASESRALAFQRVVLWSDLRLHRMGAELADLCLLDATPDEWRTPPLWGLRFRKHLLHDGRAKTTEQAIRLHGGDGLRSRRAFERLSPRDREALGEFLGRI